MHRVRAKKTKKVLSTDKFMKTFLRATCGIIFIYYLQTSVRVFKSRKLIAFSVKENVVETMEYISSNNRHRTWSSQRVTGNIENVSLNVLFLSIRCANICLLWKQIKIYMYWTTDHHWMLYSASFYRVIHKTIFQKNALYGKLSKKCSYSKYLQ